MDVISYLVRRSIPDYLSSVPVPRSVSGFTELSGKDWLHLASFTALVGTTSYVLAKPYYEKFFLPPPEHRFNKEYRLDLEKVYDIVDVEDLGEKTAFCRCWRSKQWPFCDGSHNAHNKTCGDNVGPVVLKRTVKVEES